MKPPVITVSEAPTAVKTTTIREIVPAPSSDERTGRTPAPDFWEFVRTMDKKIIGTYMLYLYRDQPGRVQIDHTAGECWEPPGFPAIPIGDQEGLEAMVARDCGGGLFQLICKQRNNSAWICSTSFRIDLPSRPINPWHIRRTPTTPTNGEAARTGAPGDPTAQIAARAMDVIAGQEHAAVNIGIDLFKAAGEVLKNRGTGGGGLEEELVRMAISRALNPPQPPPPPDPIELLTRVMNLQAMLNPTQASGNPIMGKIMDVALTRLLEPVNSAPAVSAGAEIVRSLPSIFAHGVEIAREYRLAMEAQRDGVMVMQNPPPRPPQPPPIPPPQVLAPAAPQVRPNPTPSVNPAINGGMPPGVNIVEPNGDYVDMKIMEKFNSPMSAEDAAEETIEFLYTLGGGIVETLAAMGADGLLRVFQSRILLNPATQTQNLARLREFIQAFLRLYEEDVREEAAAAVAKPN